MATQLPKSPRLRSAARPYRQLQPDHAFTFEPQPPQRPHAYETAENPPQHAQISSWAKVPERHLPDPPLKNEDVGIAQRSSAVVLAERLAQPVQ
ncbi:hypothetical protein [Streptomyces sp. NPDC005476]|uniref:hypothetical protein n=1 Tax=Streptomyces sp. NPDC005476 TaxID=3156882 RepID=UPI0034554AF0